eukprot:m.690451 g.690451  ORF g.690451 m.690451 type:complete len:1159 (+) comp22850_c1_seq1:187-3663(+)
MADSNGGARVKRRRTAVTSKTASKDRFDEGGEVDNVVVKTNNGESDSGPRSGKDLYVAPSHGELRQLQETANLFKSNLFRMQIDELVKAVRPKSKSRVVIEEALHTLKNVLDKTCDEDEETEISSDSMIEDVVPPVVLAGKTSAMKFRFYKPSKVAVVGSFLLKTCAKPRLNVDVAVEMPAAMFQAKDHINHRYAHKRAFFLAHIAAHLKKSSQFSGISFAYSQGNPLRPHLEITSFGDIKSKFVIRIHPTITEETFKVSKLSPDRNNFRLKSGAINMPKCKFDVTGAESATPHYNNCILQDMYMATHLEAIHLWGQKCDNFADAVMLLKVWLSQRGMTGETFGTLNGFSITMLLVHLLQRRKIFSDGSSFQMFRAVVSFIAESAWDTHGIMMRGESSGDLDDTQARLAKFHAGFDVVVVDPSGHVNLLANMTRAQYYHVRSEAKTAVLLLTSATIDDFSSLFMTKKSFENSFDMLVSCSNVTEKVIYSYPAHFLSRGGDWPSFVAALVPTLLMRALTDRVHLVVPEPRVSAVWACTAAPPSVTHVSVRVGLLVVAENVARVIDKGPAADAGPAAEQFRDFWGPKAELRRFADGSITEAVVWPRPGTPESLSVLSAIARHTLARHAKLPAVHVATTADVFDAVLLDTPDAARGQDDTTVSRAVVAKLDELQKQLRASGDKLPLAIMKVQGLSPVFRYTEPACSAGGDGAWPSWVPALEVLLLFEGSSKWPEDIVAIQKVKIAFYVKIAAVLKDEHGIHVVPTQQFVDVFVQPHVFRLYIHTPLELTLVRARRDSLAATVAQTQAHGVLDPDVAAAHATMDAAATELERFFWHLPRHTAAMHAVQMQHRSFGAAVRLAKRWASAHLLLGEHAGAVSDAAVELVMAALYLAPHPHPHAPGAAHVALVRFLELVSTHDWAADPLVVVAADTHTGDTGAAVAGAVEAFRANREQFPSWTILTADDVAGNVWTRTGPTAATSKRLVLLARSSLAFMRTCLGSLDHSAAADGPDVRTLFRTNTSHFDVLIHLKKAAVPRRSQSLANGDTRDGVGGASPYKNLAVAATSGEPPRPDFDPAQLFLEELRAQHGTIAQFYHDKYGGSTIGVKWRTQAVAAHPFKAKYSQHARPASADTDTAVKLNVAGVLEDFRILGGSIVRAVETQ